ncbi:MAG: hypothetical protein U9N12_03080 [Euryarchaeota archaeon]|nr:hypothetical protein [Euryarchaeota archaeon]
MTPITPTTRFLPVLTLATLTIILVSSGTALADVTYTDHIDIRANAIAVQITETYTGGDAAIVERNIAEADDRSAYIREAENNILAWSDSYIIIDDDPLQTETVHANVTVTNASGTFLINSTIKYAVTTPLDSGSHSIWIQGHPGIVKRTIIIPDGIDMDSIVGIKDRETMEEAGYTIITGVSDTRKFLSDSGITFEYATVVEVCKRPLYAQSWFLPLLVAAEIALCGLWLVRRKRQ